MVNGVLHGVGSKMRSQMLSRRTKLKTINEWTMQRRTILDEHQNDPIIYSIDWKFEFSEALELIDTQNCVRSIRSRYALIMEIWR